jgi:hypothetical protein
MISNTHITLDKQHTDITHDKQHTDITCRQNAD